MKEPPIKERLSAVVKWMALEQFFDHRGCIKTPKHDVWRVASLLMDEAMSPKYVYQVLKEGRWGLLARIREECGVYEEAALQLSSSSESSDGDCDWNPTRRNEKQIILPRMTFPINIAPDKWEQIAPKERIQKRSDRTSGQRRKLKFPQGLWTNVVQDLICDQFRLPCPFVFHNHQIALEPTLARNFVHFNVSCRECGNEGEGRIENTPMPGETVILYLECQDSRKVPHSTKRQCQGSERQRVGKGILACGSAALFRRQEATMKMKKPGEQEPPTLYELPVLAKAKEEEEDRTLNLVKSQNAMQAVEDMKYSTEFAGTIHKVGRDPVEVRYDTPGQVLLYRTLKAKVYIRVHADATAGLVTRLTRPNGRSGHIFLFELTAETMDHRFAVAQLLSEAQDTNSIASWLIDAVRRGVKDPDEALCDNSGALLGALCRAYARVFDTKTYKEMCFLYLTNQSTVLPHCFIRQDVNHLMGWAGKWKVWRNIPNKMIKDHYMRFLGLAVKCKTLEEERSCLLKILTLSFASTYGETDEGEKVAAQVAIDYLLNAVRGREELEPPVEEEQLQDDDEDFEDLEDDGEDANGDPEDVTAWATQLATEAEELANQEGSSINPYYSKDVHAKFIALAKTCMLWSAIMVGPFKSPFDRATTAYLEGDINDLKHRVLKKEAKPMKINKMVALHVRSIHGRTLITSAKVCQATESEDPPQDDGDNGDLDKVENWRGLGTKTASRKKKGYLEAEPAVEQATTAKLKEKPADLLLQNGSNSGPIETTPGTFIIVRNTCAFDSLMQLLARGILDYDNFRDEVRGLQNLNTGLAVAMSLATNGATPETYSLRATTLATHLDLQQSREVPRRTRAARALQTKIMQYEMPRDSSKRKRPEDTEDSEEMELELKFDSFGNLYNLANQILPVFPSRVQEWTCPAGHKASRSLTFVSPHFEVLQNSGIGSLADAIHFDFATDNRDCPRKSCNHEMTTEVRTKGHLLIDLECLRGKKQAYDLNAIPKELALDEKRFALVGCVCYSNGHYVAYGRNRGANKWDLMDDTRKHICNASKGKKNVHLLLYVHCVP